MNYSGLSLLKFLAIQRVIMELILYGPHKKYEYAHTPRHENERERVGISPWIQTTYFELILSLPIQS